MSLAGGKALPGTCAPPRKGRGTGPVGYKLFAVANDAGDNGRGRSERAKLQRRAANGVPPTPALQPTKKDWPWWSVFLYES